ncbi:MAG: FtsX-like permease family protein [Thiolinea sp.]
MLGLTGSQLFRSLLLEALALGLLGSLLGLVLGVLLGQGLLIMVSRTISDLFIEVRATEVLLSWSSVFEGLGITLLAVLLATLAPALETARVQPIQSAAPFRAGAGQSPCRYRSGSAGCVHC